MLKRIQKLAMLLPIAAMFMFTSCNKTVDVGPFAPDIPDSVISGYWIFADTLCTYPHLSVSKDHICRIDEMHYTWTINGKKFHGFNRGWDTVNLVSITNFVDFEIRNMTDSSMTIKGNRTFSDGSRIDYSGDMLLLHR